MARQRYSTTVLMTLDSGRVLLAAEKEILFVGQCPRDLTVYGYSEAQTLVACSGRSMIISPGLDETNLDWRK
jgi:hypothetical protein